METVFHLEKTQVLAEKCAYFMHGPALQTNSAPGRGRRESSPSSKRTAITSAELLMIKFVNEFRNSFKISGRHFCHLKLGTSFLDIAKLWTQHCVVSICFKSCTPHWVESWFCAKEMSKKTRNFWRWSATGNSASSCGRVFLESKLFAILLVSHNVSTLRSLL